VTIITSSSATLFRREYGRVDFSNLSFVRIVCYRHSRSSIPEKKKTHRSVNRRNFILQDLYFPNFHLFQSGTTDSSEGMATSTSITTVIFDIGGVVVKSPLLGINKCEKAHGLPHDYLNVAITARGPSGAFQKLEVGELQLPDFYEQVSRLAILVLDRTPSLLSQPCRCHWT